MNRKPQLIAAVFFCLALLSLSAAAQSGRKQKKADPQPPVQGVNQPEARVEPPPTAAPEKDEEKEKQDKRMLYVMSAMPDIGVSNWYADIAREGCVREIHDLMKSLVVRAEGNRHRSDAIKVAKDDEETWVVYLEIQADNFSNYGVELRYTLFEPKTAKVIGTGIGYPTQPSGTTMPPIGASRYQVMLDWMGRDVAHQVLKRLGWRG
jgi:hypothetical protein